MPMFLDSILQTFKTPPREFSPVPTWWWSGEKVEAGRLRWQMEQYAAGGIYNLIVLNLAAAGPTHGCDADDPPFFSEAWWTLFLGACADAKQLGMRLWFYDQIGFSGANFQGRLVSQHPEWAGQALDVIDPPSPVPSQGRQLGLYHQAGTGRSRVVYSVDRGFDYFNPAACAQLLDTVHGEFERRAGAYLGNTIAGSFQDELPNMPAWSPGFAEAFQRRAGYALLDHLDALWEDHAPDAARIRHDYHRVRAELAEEAFFIPLFRWHERHGLLCGCDQQSPARAAAPVGSTEKYADYARTHRWYAAPGSDHEGHAKLHSSLAHLYDRPRVWLEAFHSTGWGGTLEETFDWLLPWIRAGVTLYAPHADYYSTRGGWWEWAAPSTCWRQPYWKHYPDFAATISRLCWLLSRGHHICDLAVLYPTATVQAGLRLNGPDARAQAAHEAWLALTGTMDWQKQRPGWIDGWNRDYDALDDASLARAEVRNGQLVIGAEAFSTLILPACTFLATDIAAVLNRFVEAGGCLIALHALPTETPDADLVELARLRAHFAAGRAHFAADETVCRAVVELTPATVAATVPTLHRRIDGLNVLLVTATPGMATVVHPPAREWWARRSYDFLTDRYARSMEILLRGARGEPFLLDPFDGGHKAVVWRDTPEGVVVQVPFSQGPAALIAWPEASAGTSPAPEKFQPLEKALFTFSNVWKSELVPTIDNRHGDFTRPAEEGPFAVQTWSFEHRVESTGETIEAVRRSLEEPASEAAIAPTVIAGFGRHGWRRGPAPNAHLSAAPWEAVVYSLSRGLFKDPIHTETLGPKGHVAEDFIHFGSTNPGESVQFRTRVWMNQPTRIHLAIGSAGVKQAWINGCVHRETGAGFLWLCPIELLAGWNELVWEVAPDRPVNLRAYWALVDDAAAFSRPEWMTTADAPEPDTLLHFATTWTLPDLPVATELQLGCSAPCRLLINGVEAGRQGGFDPYKIGLRVERYALTGLAAGPNRIEVEVRDVGVPVQLLVDARADDTHLLMSNAAWTVCRENATPTPVTLDRRQFKEIGWSHLWRRSHPLPGAAWLESQANDGVVRMVIPDAPAESDGTAEWLRWKLPPGACSMILPTSTPTRVWVDGTECAVKGGKVQLPSHARVAVARIETGPGRYGGGLLDGPVCYEMGEGSISLGDWMRQGLETYSGGVRYRQTFQLDRAPEAACILDLGRVRGTAEVRINGEPAGARFLSPYRFAIGPLLRPGANEVEVTIFNTLAPWLEVQSPTRFIWSGTEISGLFGPVQIRSSNG